MSTSASGLRDVEAVDSSITAITTEGLFYRGYALDEVLEQATYEELAFALWFDRRPDEPELESSRREFAQAWILPDAVLAALRSLPDGLEPLRALQAILPILAYADTLGADDDRRALHILAQVPAVLAHRAHGEPAQPIDAERPLAAQILQALGADPLPAKAADAALMLYADHELAASTFAARIAAAALAGRYDGLSAALAVLRGPLHGGSTLEVAALVRELVDAPQLDAALGAVVRERRRIPGFGHSVYRSGDPRAAHFRTLTGQIAAGAGRLWFDVAVALDAHVSQTTGLHANVDLYGVTFMHAAGLPDRMLVPVFAVARTAGWLAHMREQQQNNRLIRPRAHYEGTFGRAWQERGSP